MGGKRPKNRQLASIAKAFGDRAADRITDIVGSWSFVACYTLAITLWIALHELGYLQIDTPDYVRWNLLVSWFAGAQASILLMSDQRQQDRDRHRMSKILHMTTALDALLEEYVMEQEKCPRNH